MRIKDELKQNALFEATIKVVNEIGFAASSVSRIAEEAGISPATIYIYHKSKEDLLAYTYMGIKKNFGRALLDGFDQNQPVRDVFKRIWNNGLEYFSRHRDHVHFLEQFSNSPCSDSVDQREIEELFRPIVATFHRGVEQKILKDTSFRLFAVFVYHPIYTLSTSRRNRGFETGSADIERAFDMAWDAVKL